MHPGQPGQLPQRGHRLRAGRHPLRGHPVRRHPAQPPDQRVRDRHPGESGDELQRPQRPDRPDPGQDRAPAVQPEVAHPGQPAGERRHVEHELGLHELGAVVDLGGQPVRAARRRCPPRRAGSAAAGRPPAGQQHAVVAQRARGPIRPPELRSNTAVASAWSPRSGRSPVISSRLGTPSAPAASRSDCSAIRLRSRAGHLHHRFQAGGQRGHAAGQAGHPHLGALVVGDVGRVHPAPQHRGGLPDRAEVRPARRPDLRGDREPPVRRAARSRECATVWEHGAARTGVTPTRSCPGACWSRPAPPG